MRGVGFILLSVSLLGIDLKGQKVALDINGGNIEIINRTWIVRFLEKDFRGFSVFVVNHLCKHYGDLINNREEIEDIFLESVEDYVSKERSVGTTNKKIRNMLVVHKGKDDSVNNEGLTITCKGDKVSLEVNGTNFPIDWNIPRQQINKKSLREFVTLCYVNNYLYLSERPKLLKVLLGIKYGIERDFDEERFHGTGTGELGSDMNGELKNNNKVDKCMGSYLKIREVDLGDKTVTMDFGKGNVIVHLNNGDIKSYLGGDSGSFATILSGIVSRSVNPDKIRGTMDDIEGSLVSAINNYHANVRGNIREERNKVKSIANLYENYLSTSVGKLAFREDNGVITILMDNHKFPIRLRGNANSMSRDTLRGFLVNSYVAREGKLVSSQKLRYYFILLKALVETEFSEYEMVPGESDLMGAFSVSDIFS